MCRCDDRLQQEASVDISIALARRGYLAALACARSLWLELCEIWKQFLRIETASESAYDPFPLSPYYTYSCALAETTGMLRKLYEHFV